MRNAFSVDVEDWYQVSDFEAVVDFSNWGGYESRVVRNTERVLQLLADHRVTATFFVLTWNAERHPELVRRIADAGHEIASHGYRHRLIYEQTPAAFRDDVMRSKKILEDATGTAVLGYRAPSFSLTRASLWALDVLLECGFRYDSSIFPISDRLYGIPNARRFPFAIRTDGERTLWEFPMSTAHAAGRNWPLGGGAYLRLFPYRYMRWGIRRVNREGQPALVYVHPWELDPEQPRIKTSGKRGVSTHYLNLHRTEAKLRRLLQDFAFASAREILELR
ncbi:MAG: polysaccharide deacetylase family protein [Candidatus Rokuibacteriota bacterium]|nr:MAG: polysaccharide deacetylase family protein [Candidatus Rokubacteria bacterium]